MVDERKWDIQDRRLLIDGGKKMLAKNTATNGIFTKREGGRRRGTKLYLIVDRTRFDSCMRLQLVWIRYLPFDPSWLVR